MCFTALFLFACIQKTPEQRYQEIQALMEEPIELTASSPQELQHIFNQHHYNNANWIKGNRVIPRITFSTAGKPWYKQSGKLSLQEKQQLFIRLMTPLVLIANENIEIERQIALNAPLNAVVLKKLAHKYRVIDSYNAQVDEQVRLILLSRVDIMPPSLVLANALQKSGLATAYLEEQENRVNNNSQFLAQSKATQINSTGSKKRRVTDPLASVEEYILNININNEYQQLRITRANLRVNQQPITGIELADSLIQAPTYTNNISQLITNHKLFEMDLAQLADNQLIHLTKG